MFKSVGFKEIMKTDVPWRNFPGKTRTTRGIIAHERLPIYPTNPPPGRRTVKRHKEKQNKSSFLSCANEDIWLSKTKKNLFPVFLHINTARIGRNTSWHSSWFVWKCSRLRQGSSKKSTNTFMYLINQSTNQPINRTINRPINWSINRTMDQSIEQWTNQSTNQSNNQSTNQSIE